MSFIVLTVGWQSYAVQFTPKMAEALTLFQASAISAESFYKDGCPIKWEEKPGGRAIEIQIVPECAVGVPPAEEVTEPA